jgi:serine/threonine-protein kinase
MEIKSQQDDERLMSLVALALAQPENQRESYLESACSGNGDLFSQAWNYVQWEARMQGFLLDPLFPPAEDETPFEPGQLLDSRFRIVREVARGGMGIVYEAADEKLDRRIALKCARSGFRKRLPPEVRHASEISHPNVCKIFEIHTALTADGEVDFLTMEFLDGETLAARLGRGPLPEAEARAIAEQICAGLAEAHRKRVVHGDLKSNNVILARDAVGGVRAVITDFGLARRPFSTADDIAFGAAGSSQAGGTPDYMAPELWKGEKPSAASDVYALGVILYELIGGQRPGPAPGRLKQKPPAVHHQWDSIVQRCLDADPAERFRDAVEVVAALEASRSRRWWTKAAAAIIVSAIALAAASGLVTYDRATAPKESVRLAMLPLQIDSGAAVPGAADVAARISHDAADQLARLKGGTSVRLSVVPGSEVFGRHADTVEKARALGATHVVVGTIAWDNGKVTIHASFKDARTQVNSGDWTAVYAPGEVHYAPVAMTGMVTAALHLPPLTMAPVKAAAMQDYLDGVKYTHRDSTVDRALPLLETAVAVDSDSPLTWAALGEAQWFKYHVTNKAEWLNQASESLRQAQGRNLDLAPVHRLAGLLLAAAGHSYQAEAEYLRAIDLEPSNGDAYRRLGLVYDKTNRNDRALAVLKQAVEVVPDDFKAYQSLGAHYADYVGDEREAARQYEKCVQLAPDEPDCHRALGTAYKNLGRNAEAERELRLAVQLAPTPAALVNLASALMYWGRSQEAIPYLESAVSQSPGESLWWMDLGIAYSRVDRRRNSDTAFHFGVKAAEDTIGLNPSDGTVRSRLAFLYARVGDRKRAETEIAQALSLAPESSVTRGTAVWTYEALGLREETMGILESSSDDVLADAARWPDLVELHKDTHFQQLLASRDIKR